VRFWGSPGWPRPPERKPQRHTNSYINYSNIDVQPKILIFKTVIRPTLLYRSPLYRELYVSTLIKLQQFENRLLLLKRDKIKFIRDTLHISTVKSFIIQRHIQFYHNIHHMSSPLFSHVRAPTYMLAPITHHKHHTTTHWPLTPIRKKTTPWLKPMQRLHALHQ
jgi:hypothetical protein